MFGGQVDSLETMKQAAQELHKLGPRFVLVKGGHLIDEAKSEDSRSSGMTRAIRAWHTPVLCPFAWECIKTADVKKLVQL